MAAGLRQLGVLTLGVLLVTSQAHRPTSKEGQLWWDLAQNELAAALNVRDNWNVAKNVILFLGDGMGITANTAARIYKGQKKGMNGEEGFLTWERFPNAALLKPYSVDKQVPDSSATATAFLSGVKTNSRTVGVDSRVKSKDCAASQDVSTHLPSILQWAQEAGMETGFVTTTRITHATPAALYAHTAYRSWECDGKLKEEGAGCKDIADQLVSENPGRKIRVILGGGRASLGAPLDAEHPEGLCLRKDGRDLTEEWLQDKLRQGHTACYVTTGEEMKQINPNKTHYLMGLFADSHLPYVVEQHENDTSVPSLKEMMLTAIDFLKRSGNGFFLLVEGGRIDHGLHLTSPYRALEETLAMDDAVEAALKEVDLNDTTVLVTADHSHVMAINGYPDRGNDILGVTGYPSKMDSLNYTTLMFTVGPGYNFTVTEYGNVTRPDPNTQDPRDLEYKALTAVPEKSERHGGEDIAIWAAGPMAHLLHRTHEQNYVAHVMAHAAGIGPSSSRRQTPGHITFPGVLRGPAVDNLPSPFPSAPVRVSPERPKYPIVDPELQEVIDDMEEQILKELSWQPVDWVEEDEFSDEEYDH